MKSSNHLCRLSLEGKQKRVFVAKKNTANATCRSSFQIQIIISKCHIIFTISETWHNLRGSLYFHHFFLQATNVSAAPHTPNLILQAGHTIFCSRGVPKHTHGQLEEVGSSLGKAWNPEGTIPTLRVGRGIVHIRSLVGEVYMIVTSFFSIK